MARHEPRPAPHGAQRAVFGRPPRSRRCARAALAQGAAARRCAHISAGRGHKASGASSTLQRQCCGAALLLLPERLRRDAAHGSHAAGAHVARTVHTCCASVGLHTLRSVVRPGNAAEPSAASRQRFLTAAAKGATRKRSADQRETQSTAVCEARLPFSDFGKHEARRPQHDTAPLQLVAHTGTLTQPPPASHSADAIIMREMRRTHAPGKQSAPGMKTLEGSPKSARVSREAASQRRYVAALRSWHVKLQRAPSFPPGGWILCLASICLQQSSCVKRFNASVGEGLGFRDEDFPKPRRTARPLG